MLGSILLTDVSIFILLLYMGEGWGLGSLGLDSHKDLSNLAYIAEAMRSRLLRAAIVMGAPLIDSLVASCIYLGTAFGPLAWDGQLGEK